MSKHKSQAKAARSDAEPVAKPAPMSGQPGSATTRTDGVKRAKPFDAAKPPPRKGDAVDLAKLKEERREAPDEAPALPTAEERPAKIHPLPHEVGVPREAGEDPEEALEAAREAGAVDPETPFPDQQAQTLHGLRKDGRLYRARLRGYRTLLVEADSPEQAREAALAEYRRLAGEESKEQKKAKKSEAGAGLPAMPPGYVAMPVGAVDPSLVKAPVAAEAVRVTKLLP